MKATELAMLVLPLCAITAFADHAAAKYVWTGAADASSDSLAANYWLAAANWTVDGAVPAEAPGNNDTAVFSRSDETTVYVNAGAHASTPIQAVNVTAGAGQVTISLAPGWYSPRTLLFRRIGEGSAAPAVTNILNESSHPIEFTSNSHTTFKVEFNNSWGDFAVSPGVIYDCNVTMNSNTGTGWFLPIATAKDDEELNRSVFKRSVEFGSATALNIGANHELWVSGTSASLNVPGGATTVAGKLVVDGGTATLATVTLVDDGAIELRGAATFSADSVEGLAFALVPEFSAASDGTLAPTAAKIAKKDGMTAPVASQFTVTGVSGMTAATLGLLSVEIDSESDSDYYLVNVSPASFAVMSGTNYYNTDWTAGSLWYGADGIVSGTHYLITGSSHRLNTTISEGEATTFAGESLTIAGDSESSGCYLGLKNTDQTVSDLRLGAHGGVRFQNTSTWQNQTLSGGIYVGSDTSSGRAWIHGGDQPTTKYTLASTISGSGILAFKNGYVTITGDNSSFTGEFVMDATVTNTVSTASALGGGAVTLDGARLNVTDDIAASQAFTFSNSPTIEIAEGKTLTFTGSGSGSVTLNGGTAVTESGLAARIVIAEGSTATATLPSLSVTEEETAARAFAAREFIFVPGGSLESEPAENLALLTANGWKLPRNYGLAGGWAATLTQEEYSVDGVDGVMLYVSGKIPGFAIIVR